MSDIKCAFTKMVAIDKIIINPKNANKHPHEQIKRLSEIIDMQGQRSPLVISKRSGFLVKGHGRLAAIKLLKWSDVACDYQDYESEAQEYADMIADNEIARWAEFDLEKVKLDIKEIDFDLSFDMLGLQDFNIDLDDSVLNECEDDYYLKLPIVQSH